MYDDMEAAVFTDMVAASPVSTSDASLISSSPVSSSLVTISLYVRIVQQYCQCSVLFFWFLKCFEELVMGCKGNHPLMALIKISNGPSL